MVVVYFRYMKESKPDAEASEQVQNKQEGPPPGLGLVCERGRRGEEERGTWVSGQEDKRGQCSQDGRL